MNTCPVSGASISKGTAITTVEAHHDCPTHGTVTVTKRFASRKKAEAWVDTWLDQWECLSEWMP